MRFAISARLLVDPNHTARRKVAVPVPATLISALLCQIKASVCRQVTPFCPEQTLRFGTNVHATPCGRSNSRIGLPWRGNRKATLQAFGALH
jgi:hypothetical protein